MCESLNTVLSTLINNSYYNYYNISFTHSNKLFVRAYFVPGSLQGEKGEKMKPFSWFSRRNNTEC